MRKWLKKIGILVLVVAACYGAGRVYFNTTAGFSIENISSDFAFNPDWEVQPLSPSEQNNLNNALGQTYHYLGKGCQSYVFESNDGQYVIKFFKYQRYRLLPWLTYFPPLPAVVEYREEKLNKKWKKLDGFVRSWKVAFENLKEETGLVFVHLNKTDYLNTKLELIDKIGFKHTITLDQMEFCVQKKAQMLCPVLLELKKKGDFEGAKLIIDRLLSQILSEYARGLGDNDHALMQNTGVADGHPVHIDVGQFVFNEKFKDPNFANQELFTKTYKFKIWMHEEYLELFEYLEQQLIDIMGASYYELKPKFRKK